MPKAKKTKRLHKRVKKVAKKIKAVRKAARRTVKKKFKKILEAKMQQARRRAKQVSIRKKEVIELPPPLTVELQVGQPAPEFRLKTDTGEEVSLSDFRGKKVILYFYPKDDTPGCTKEACAFRDGFSQIQEKGAVVLGASIDPVTSHQTFKEKFQLNFPLLSDPNKEIVQAYGVWKERSMYGRTFMGVERTTFIIDEEGRIAKTFPKVSVENHFEEVLTVL